MDECCNGKAFELQALKASQKRMLQIVLGINAVFFLVELIAGLLAHSTALLADSLDMFGDALVYGLPLRPFENSKMAGRRRASKRNHNGCIRAGRSGRGSLQGANGDFTGT